MKPILQFEENRPLRELCTLGIGGPARYCIEVNTIEQMRLAMEYCQAHSLPYLVLGKGSNCLFDDEGFHGMVIVNKIDFLETPSSGLFHAGAGYSFSLLGTQTARQGFSGLEFASGIPGTVGGAVFMNAGANGMETCDTLISVDFMNSEGALSLLPKEQLRFAYRLSPFQQMKGAIIGASFQLVPSTIARAKQLELHSYRKRTQPYQDKSAGCIFRNPSCGQAGALIDQCGLKGTSVGGAKVSEIHANFLINSGNATCKEFCELIKQVKARVKEKTGIELEPEVRYIPAEHFLSRVS
jgi:UDP-N-acetylmuramate dehydrogenase